VNNNGQTEQRDYLDGIEYKDGKPDQFHHSEGTVRRDENGAFHYSFVLRDHLGNTRVTFSDLNDDAKIDEYKEIIQINNYYAFGLNMEGNWNGKDGANKYQYSGKELNDDFGLGWSDHGARFYDPAMARWHSIDPLADKYPDWSPYNYVMSNPINSTDPTGMEGEPAGKCITCLPSHQEAMQDVRWTGLVTATTVRDMDQHGNNPTPPQPQQGSGTPAADPSISSKGTPMVNGVSATTDDTDCGCPDPPCPQVGRVQSHSLGVAAILGFGVEVGRAWDNQQNYTWFIRTDMRIGIGIELFSENNYQIYSNEPFKPSDVMGYDFTKSFVSPIYSWSKGGNTLSYGSHRGGLLGEKYGVNYFTKGSSFALSNFLKSGAAFAISPIGVTWNALRMGLFGVGYFRSYGYTF
jgi:RHS repeat-associated protein